jgi:cytochrome P450
MAPFSLGPRGCIGKHLSYMEMRVIMGRLLWNYDISSVDGAWEWDPTGEMRNMKAFVSPSFLLNNPVLTELSEYMAKARTKD